MDKKWIPFRQEDGSVLKKVMLSALIMPGRSGRELLVKIIFSREM